jgi:3-hydroxyisobutyrate dehydrogenase
MLVNNTLLAFTAEGLASSIALAHHLGLNSATVIDALDGGPLMSRWESAKPQRIANEDYSPQFALSLALKDAHLALDEVVTPSPGGRGRCTPRHRRPQQRGP